MSAVLRHPVETDIHVVARVGHRGVARGRQLWLLAAAHRNADVHPHGARVQPQGGRRAVRVAVPVHVLVANARVVRGRPADQAERRLADHVPEDVEHGGHVGRRRRPGRARLPGRRHVHHRAVRAHRGHRVRVQRRVQHQPHGPVGQLRGAADGLHQYARVVRRHHRPHNHRAHRQRPGERARTSRENVLIILILFLLLLLLFFS